jgi:hypothetical protein
LSYSFAVVWLWGQAQIEGKVTDSRGEPLPGATIKLLQNGTLKTGAAADFDGNYLLTGFDPGTYDVEASFAGMQTQRIEKISVGNNTVKVDVKLEENSLVLGSGDEVKVVAYRVPIVSLIILRKVERKQTRRLLHCPHVVPVR